MLRSPRLVTLVIALLLLTLLPAAERPPLTHAAGVGIRWAWYVTYDSKSFDSLSANVGSLDIVSPWYYKLDGAGNVIGSATPAVDNLLRAHHVKILPMIQNLVGHQGFHTLLADPVKRDALIDKLYHLVIDGNYDGINVDFEALLPTDASLYTDFSARLASRLHTQHKLITMDLAAKTRDGGDFAGVYDYAALGGILDYAAVMAYDFHYMGGSPGPVAPVGWVNDVAAYTNSRIAPAKVVWGIDLYGLDWNKTTHALADSIHYADVLARKQQFNGQGNFDPTAQSPWITYTDGSGNQHEVWYENAASIAAKLNVIQPYSFAGIALWRLGHEDPAVWPLLASAAHRGNGCDRIVPFPSTADHVYFLQTGHSLAGRFLRYWQQHGGLAIYGYPLTEEHTEISATDGKVYTVQYFERNRFEYHPANQPPYDVLLGLLGVQALGDNFAPPRDPVSDTSTQHYFPETQHLLRGGFFNYWQQHGGLAQFGYPLTDEIAETSPTDGKVYTVQYFERVRFEFHPENQPPNDVLLGLLGVDNVRTICH
ncbi:MAG: peptidoglycan hydrolase [Candidatus Chloroheliales bacterium]|nr:MAG: peptidoglycan hydrolase [Chloroflexota bacterium]